MSEFPQTLKTWRKTRRLSQLDLALEAEVSARHISFLESGRASPSREMVSRLGDALQMPLAARNQMLTNAGFARRFPARAWGDEALAPIAQAVTRMLRSHAPFPGIAADSLWRIVEMNDPAAFLFGQLGVGVGDSLLDLMLSEHVPQFVENWPEVAHHVAGRLRTESAAMGGVATFDRAAQHLSQQALAEPSEERAVIPTVFAMGDLRLSLFATIAQFGTPEDVVLDAFKVELYFPTDAETEAVLRSISAST
ncbi:MAG: helix-turn-helix domain-containing protein [Pseudomonadota bacterium]